MQLPFGGVAMVLALAGWFFVIDYGGTFVIDWLGPSMRSQQQLH